jgi:hypothetical protein
MHARVRRLERMIQEKTALLTLVDGTVEVKDQLKDYK